MTSKDIGDLINKALALKETDIDSSKALILTAKTLFPKSFEVFFTDYQLQKASGSCHQAAKSFSYIVLCFDNPEILEEIKILVQSLKMADKSESKLSPESEFYVNMFQYFANGPAGQKIIMLLTSDSDNDFTYIRIMKKFGKSNFNLSMHAPRLLEKILAGIKVSPVESTELLVKEVLPLMMTETMELSSDLVNRVLVIVFKYHIAKLWDHSEGKQHLVEESRAKIIELFDWVGKLLKWEPFAYIPTWTKDFYWQKLKLIETTTCDSKQIFYLSCFLFFISVQDYLVASRVKIEGQDVQYALVDGLSDLIDSPPSLNILHEPPFPPEASTSFLTAFKAQELLQRNVIFFKDFNQLLFDLNITRYISRIVVDIAIYLRSNTDSYNRINSCNMMCNLERNMRLLSLVINAPNTTREVFEYIRLIMSDLPTVNGSFLKNLSLDRNLLFLPLTRIAIVQYCTRIIVSSLKRKAFKDPTKIDDYQLGSLLVLLQLEYYDNIPLVEHIFEIIRAKGLDFPLFHSFIINIDMIEEFMNLWRGHEVILRLSSSASTPTQRRIGTRNADKSTKEDFKQIIKQQVLRSNEDVVGLIIQFIEQEHLNLLQNLTAF